MEVAGKQDVSSPAPVASEPSQQSDADLLLAMHKKALQQAQEIVSELPTCTDCYLRIVI